MDTIGVLVSLLLVPAVAPAAPACLLTAATASEVRTVAASPDGAAVAAATADRAVRVWQSPDWQERLAFKLAAPIAEIHFTPDGRRLAAVARGLELWELGSRRRVLALPDFNGYQIAYAADGVLAAAGYRLALHEAGTLQARRTVDGQTGWLSTCVAFSGDGGLVAAGDTAGNFQVWDAATGALRLRRKGHENRVTGVGFIDEGRTVITGGSDGRMKFWDLKTGREVGVLFPHDSAGIGRGIGALACTPDGRTIATAGAGDGRVRLWEAATARLRATLTLPGASITSLSIARDGSTLAAGGKRDGGGIVAAWRLYAPAPSLAPRRRPALWQELAGDSRAAYRAMLWAAAQPRDAVALLGERLRPVRLDAAVRRRCDELIGRLEDERFEVREAAQGQLETLSPWVEPYLRRALAEAKTIELQRRLQALLGKVGPSTLPLLRAVEVLEHVAGPEARELLRQLAEGEPAARVTHEARRALDRQKASSTKDTKEHEEDRNMK